MKARTQGGVSRAERIRELHAKGYPIDVISQRVQIKHSEIKRVLVKLEKAG